MLMIAVYEPTGRFSLAKMNIASLYITDSYLCLITYAKYGVKYISINI